MTTANFLYFPGRVPRLLSIVAAGDVGRGLYKGGTIGQWTQNTAGDKYWWLAQGPWTPPRQLFPGSNNRENAGIYR